MTAHSVDIAFIPVGSCTSAEAKELNIVDYWRQVKRQVDDELSAEAPYQQADLKNQLFLLADGCNSAADEQHTNVTLDWAMAIRQATDYDWATCLRLAGVFYYG